MLTANLCGISLKILFIVSIKAVYEASFSVTQLPLRAYRSVAKVKKTFLFSMLCWFYGGQMTAHGKSGAYQSESGTRRQQGHALDQ